MDTREQITIVVGVIVALLLVYQFGYWFAKGVCDGMHRSQLQAVRDRVAVSMEFYNEYKGRKDSKDTNSTPKGK